MKKTTVVLLVLIFAGVGLFADVAELGRTYTPQLIFNADIGENSIVKVTGERYEFSAYDALAALEDTVTSPVVITAANYKRNVLVGYLNYFTNQPAGITIGVEATPLSSPRLTDVVNYRVYLGLVWGLLAIALWILSPLGINWSALPAVDIVVEAMRFMLTSMKLNLVQLQKEAVTRR